MEKRTFNKFREIVYEKSGISLSESKVALVSARVGKRMRTLGMDDYKSYLKMVVSDESGEEIVHLLDAISTNVTHFFRESNHFDFLADVIKKWNDKGQRRFRVWSAASSSGEEPYSIAMTMLSTLEKSNIDLKILATDISTKVLSMCVKGLYTEDKLNTVPKDYVRKYFDVTKSPSGTLYQVKNLLKQLIVFRRLNLSRPPFPMRGPLDIIFCRNVMIYFDNVVRKRLLDEMFRLLKPGGYLMVGHAESLTGLVSEFKGVKPSIYIRP